MKRRQFIIGLTSGAALFAYGMSLNNKRNLIQEKTNSFIDLTKQEVEQLDKYLMPIALSSIASLATLMYFWDNIFLILGFILLAITGLFY
ncbi:hypothetical protein OAT61_02095 [Gammaproteobacteria bacterium]|nr:hypothetical protein [Gammaproteobacteria bacterium]